jgi:predicted DNA-binding ArsR family transcriptional regulator
MSSQQRKIHHRIYKEMSVRFVCDVKHLEKIIKSTHMKMAMVKVKMAALCQNAHHIYPLMVAEHGQKLHLAKD